MFLSAYVVQTDRKTNLSIFSRMNIGLLYVMAVFYIAAGIFHFVQPGFYQKMMPPWLPSHATLILLSGIAEIILGVLLIPKVTRKIAAWGVIVLLIAVFPANIQMAINYWQESNPNQWIAILRLPLQLVLIGWAWQYTK